METNKNTETTRKKQNRNYYSSYPKLVALSFFALIMIGTVLLMLPISVKTGNVSFIDAFFTATSACCVTGLIVFDTFTKWTLFGQIVILCLIQVGGLGFITIITMLSRFIKKKVSLREKLLLKESIGSIYTGDAKRLVKIVVSGTVIFELLGAVILCTQYIPEMGIKNGIYTSVFLSVSAFCNAGFDVMGRIAPGSSLMTVNNNPVILITIAFLIIIGGIGFIVWEDIAANKLKCKRYNFYTKLTLATTAVLLIGGTIIYLVFERNNTLENMPPIQAVINAFFASTTARTAGFNSIPISEMSGVSKVLTYILMLIGGSSASTAGGIKTVTVAVLFLCITATLRNSKEIEVFGKRITDDIVRRAAAIFLINCTEVFAASLLISLFNPEFSYTDILFECFSAIGTVGMTAGITPHLALASKIIIAAMMFIGRITSLTFVFSIYTEKSSKDTKKPKGNLLIG